MKRVIHAVALIGVVATLAPSLLAQWADYPTPGVPRNAKGEVDMAAPPPRTADGKPDLSGVWRGVGATALGQPSAGANPVPPQSGPPVAGFRDVAAGFKEGLPLTAWGAEVLKTRMAGNSKDNPEAHCLPMGIVQFHTQGAPRKFIQSARLLVILYEASSGIRQIFTDGRKLPTDDPQPWFYGYSVGKWDGDTMVVETNGFRDDGWLDIIGTPMSEKAKITERFRRVNYGRMEIDVTIDDPKAYTRPWTVRVNQQLMPDTELIEFICEENQRFGKQ
jgi:hypothetical protein